MEQIEILLDVKTETKAKKVMSKLKLRSMLKSMAEEGLIATYEVTHWSFNEDTETCGTGEVILSSTKAKEE